MSDVKTTLSREERLAALRAKATTVAKTAKETKQTTGTQEPKKRGATTEKTTTTTPISEELTKAKMVCLLCGSNTKPKAQMWFGEHLVLKHQVTLLQYIDSFYTPRPEFEQQLKNLETTNTPLLTINETPVVETTPETITDPVVTTEQTVDTPTETTEQQTTTVETDDLLD